MGGRDHRSRMAVVNEVNETSTGDRCAEIHTPSLDVDYRVVASGESTSMLMASVCPAPRPCRERYLRHTSDAAGSFWPWFHWCVVRAPRERSCSVSLGPRTAEVAIWVELPFDTVTDSRGRRPSGSYAG